MKLWPFGKSDLETRQSEGSYTDILLEAAFSRAEGKVASANTAAREIAAGLWGRAFASADLTPEGIVADAVSGPTWPQSGG